MSSDDGSKLDIDELRDEIAQQRAELAADIDHLADKLDVKAQASKKVHQVEDSVSERVHQTAERAQPVVQAAKQNRVPVIAAAVAGLAVIVFLVRRRR